MQSRRCVVFFASILFLLFSYGCASTPVTGGSQRVDLILEGGTIVPIAGPNLPSGSIAIDGGKIVAIGSAEEVAGKYSAAETIDVKGMAVLPGLVNSHTHAPMTLFRGIADDRDLMDWLQNFIFPAEKENVDREFVKWGTRLALAEMISSGTTTYADMYYFEADIAAETKVAGMRAVLGETLIDFPAPDNKSWTDAIAYSRDFVRQYANDSLITPALAPHAPFTVSSEHLREVRALASELGCPILIHVAETEEESRQVALKAPGMTPVGYLESLGLLGSDVLAAHGIWLSQADIAILADRKVGVAHNPESNMMLSSGVAPVRSLLQQNVSVGLGTDGPAGSNNNLDMFEEMASAARLQKITHKDPKALTARQVLEMATIGGARALGLDDRIGTLEVGKRADVIVVDLRSPRIQPIYSIESALVYAASGNDVLHTIVDGKFLMRNRRLLTIDASAALANAERYRIQVQQSLRKAGTQ